MQAKTYLLIFLIWTYLIPDLFCQSNIRMAFPPNAPVWNVKDYGALGDGSTDDTQAFKNAITAALDHNDRYTAIRIIYVPNGTYKISDRLDAKNLNRTDWSGGWRAGFFLQGESHNQTIIKLMDNAPGFTDSNNPKAVIRTGSENPTNSSEGRGNQAFRHYIRNLTVDVGSGNAGAVGIDFLVNNRGGIYDVTVKSSDSNYAGHTGILMDRAWPGPGIIKNVAVEGFQYGISMWSHYQYSMTFEHLSLRNQTVYGFRTQKNTVNIRDLTSHNSVTAIYAEATDSHITLIDAQLTGGTGNKAAIDSKSTLYVRNVSTSGYGKAIDDKSSNNRDKSGGWVEEYWNFGTFSSYADVIEEALKLPVKETPAFHTNDFSQWKMVDGSANDDLPAIQAAIDAGKAIVYLPVGEYYVSNTIILRGNVRKFMGGCAAIRKGDNFPAGAPLLRFEGGNSDNTIIQFIRFMGDIEHNSHKGLALVNMDITKSRYYNTVNGTGELFVEDAILSLLHANYPQHIWARQLNMEFASEPFLINQGGTAWLLGYKTEGKNGTPLYNKNGGWMELLGGFFYANDGLPSLPMIINEDAHLTANYKVNGNYLYTIQVEDIRGDTVRTFTRSEAPFDKNVDLYSGTNQIYSDPATAVFEDHETVISIYPNPVGDHLHIQLQSLSGLQTERKLRIYSLNGQLILEDLIPAEEKNYLLDISELSSGIYLLEIYGKTGVKRMKWIKQ